MATASAVSSCLIFEPVKRLTIFIIASLLAFPFPVICDFISLGLYSLNSILFKVSANIITPLASATFIAVLVFFEKKSSSIEALSGLYCLMSESYCVYMNVSL